jgi:hypothetical protein
MFDSPPDVPTAAAMQLHAELLERLVAAGILRLNVPLQSAATALAAELRLFGLTLEDTARAILALRAAGWPQAQGRDPDSLLQTTGVAATLVGLLADASPRQVADFLRFAERESADEPMRSIDALLPVAHKALKKFHELSADE